MGNGEISSGNFRVVKRAGPRSERDGDPNLERQAGLYRHPKEIIGPDGIRGPWTAFSNWHYDEIAKLKDPIALTIYTFLCRYRNNKDRKVHCSIRWMAKKLGVCPKTVRRKLRLLDSLEYPPVKVWWPGPHSGKPIRIIILDLV